MKYPNWVLLSFALGAIMIGMLVQSAVVSGMAQFAYPDNRWWGLVSTSTLTGVGSFGAFFVFCIRYKRAITFTDEVVGEVKQVTFPTRDETLRASTTVILTTFFTAGLLAFYDLIWKNLADVFLLGA